MFSAVQRHPAVELYTIKPNNLQSAGDTAIDIVIPPQIHQESELAGYYLLKLLDIVN